jgi:hypothetical protein
MNLATFKTYEEALFFKNSVGSYVWVGINDLATPGTILQVNGDPTPTLPWYPGDPNNVGGTHRCVVSIPEGFFQYKCTEAFSFACESFENVSCENVDQNPIFNFN